MRMNGETVLVTGAGRGIGLAIARRFLDDGALVYLTDARADAFADFSAVPNARFLQLDVTKPDDWQLAVETIRGEAGSLDVLVNNAGVDMMGPLEDIQMAQWRSLMAVNVDGLFLGVQSLLPLLTAAAGKRKGGASIVNLSSILGQKGMALVTAYSASKGAVTVLTKSLALELAGRKIRVNSVHPGFIDGPMLREGAQRAVVSGTFATEEDFVESLLDHSPLRRPGEAAEVAAVVAFLASTEASYVTGAEVNVDGGYNAS